MTDYLLVAQDRMSVRHYQRMNETEWKVQTYIKPEDVVRLESLDVTMTLADIYYEITFPEPLTLVKPKPRRRRTS